MLPQPNLAALIQSLAVRSRFIAQYPDGRFSLFSVRRRRGSSFECAIINGAHTATFDALGYCARFKMKIVYVKTDPNCPYTVNDYNDGLPLFTKHYEDFTC